MDKCKRAIIIGAGVAKGFGNVPTQAEFWTKLEEFILNKPERLLYNNYKTEVEEVWERELKSGDIEKNFSKLHDLIYSQEINTRVKQAALQLMIFYRKEIASWLSDFHQKLNFEITDRAKLPNGWNPNNTIFISTNYDEIFEDCLLATKGVHYVGFPKSEYGKWRVYKPHGSISWMEERFNTCGGNFKWSEVCPTFRRISPEKIHSLHPHPLNGAFFADEKNFNIGLNPILISFYQQKRIWYSSRKWYGLLGVIFQEMVEELKSCTEIFLIGYGLPEGDWTFREALVGLLALDSIKKVHLVIRPEMATCGWSGSDHICNCQRIEKPNHPTATMFNEIFRKNIEEKKFEFIPNYECALKFFSQ